MTVDIHTESLTIRPIRQDELDTLLEVYRQCEDFLALGPVATASMEMIYKDLGETRDEGGVYCGIYNAAGTLIGVVDYIASGFEGEPSHAYLNLLMIAAPHRSKGVGEEVVRLVEAEIMQDARVTAFFAGVQVNNPRAIWFWQRQGFQIISGPELYPDQTSAFRLRKELPRRHRGEGRVKLVAKGTNFEVREATIDDVPLLLSFIRAMAEFERVTVTATEDALRESLFGESPAARVLFVYVDGRPAGYVVYFFTFGTMTGKRGLWLDDIYIEPEQRGKGIGTAMMTHLARIAVENDCARFEWMVLDWNAAAIKLYKGLGAEMLDAWRICRMNADQLAGLAGREAPR